MDSNNIRFAQKLRVCKAKSAVNSGSIGKLFNVANTNFWQILRSRHILAENSSFSFEVGGTAALKTHNFHHKICSALILLESIIRA